MGGCIAYTGIRLLLLIRPFISSFFFLSNFETLKFFVTLFSGTVRTRRLKLGIHVDNGWLYRVYTIHGIIAIPLPPYLHLGITRAGRKESEINITEKLV